MVARLVAKKLNGGPIGAVFVENKPAASGMIAAELLTKAPANGTTLMSATRTSLRHDDEDLESGLHHCWPGNAVTFSAACRRAPIATLWHADIV
ncbi:MAG TPA: hypothetical protein VJ890_00760 [Vineibacter sp.]|nr:hypothetical protein [Vineibacter sp.]